MRLPAFKSRSFLSSLPAWVLAWVVAMPSGECGASEGPSAEELTAAQGGIETLPLDERLALSARWDLGYYLFQLHEYGAAAAEFEKIRVVLPGEATLLALIGSCYSMSGRWQEGEANLLKAREQDPADADVNGLLGQFYLSQGKGLKGAFYFEHALKTAPELVELRVTLADIYLGAGQPRRARTHLETMLNERGGEEFGEPKLEHAYARVLVEAGKFREGLPFALRAHQAQPGNPAYARTLGLCLMGTNRYAEAARMLSAGRAPGTLDSDEDIHLQLGEALFQDRRWEAAEEAWLAGIARIPASYKLFSRLADYYLGAARPGQAARVVAFAGDRNPGHPGNLLLQVHFHRKLGDYAVARKALARLKRQACGSMVYEALWEEAQLDYETGRFASCGRILDRLLAKGKADRFGHPGEAFLLKAKLALRNGDWRKAQLSVLEARDANPYNLKVYSLAKQAFSRPEDRGRLTEMMRDALDLMPGSDFLFSQASTRR